MTASLGSPPPSASCGDKRTSPSVPSPETAELVASALGSMVSQHEQNLATYAAATQQAGSGASCEVGGLQPALEAMQATKAAAIHLLDQASALDLSQHLGLAELGDRSGWEEEEEAASSSYTPSTTPIYELPPRGEGMSDVDELKARHRAARAAVGTAPEMAVTAAFAAANSSLDDPSSHPEAEAIGALEKLAATETKTDALALELAVTIVGLQAKDFAPDVDALAARAALFMAAVGELQSLMDAIDIGEIEDMDARAAARERRKKINGRVEVELEPAVQALSKAVAARRARQGVRRHRYR